MSKSTQIAVFVGVVGLIVGFVAGGRYLARQPMEQQVAITVPKLSPEATAGKAMFSTSCAGCHGENATGSDKGPPLINLIYRPAHHGDFSFVRAVTLGAPQHHWSFGPMPAQPEVNRKQIEQIVVYIRELQRANGIR